MPLRDRSVRIAIQSDKTMTLPNSRSASFNDNCSRGGRSTDLLNQSSRITMHRKLMDRSRGPNCLDLKYNSTHQRSNRSLQGSPTGSYYTYSRSPSALKANWARQQSAGNFYDKNYGRKARSSSRILKYCRSVTAVTAEHSQSQKSKHNAAPC